MNEQNLKSFSERTEKEQREIQQKGGIASGEARRRKRDLRLALEMLLEKEYTDKKGHAKFIIETYATERGYITKDEWKAKKKDLKALYKKAYNLSDMEPYEKAHNIPPLPQAVRQAIAKLKH